MSTLTAPAHVKLQHASRHAALLEAELRSSSDGLGEPLRSAVIDTIADAQQLVRRLDRLLAHALAGEQV